MLGRRLGRGLGSLLGRGGRRGLGRGRASLCRVSLWRSLWGSLWGKLRLEKSKQVRRQLPPILPYPPPPATMALRVCCLPRRLQTALKTALRRRLGRRRIVVDSGMPQRGGLSRAHLSKRQPTPIINGTQWQCR